MIKKTGEKNIFIKKVNLLDLVNKIGCAFMFFFLET